MTEKEPADRHALLSRELSGRRAAVRHRQASASACAARRHRMFAAAVDPLVSSPSPEGVSRVRCSRAAEASTVRMVVPALLSYPNDIVPSRLKNGDRGAREILVGEEAHIRLRWEISAYRARVRHAIRLRA